MATKVLLEKVKSSNIARIGHDEDLNVLYIKFIGGGLYSYFPVRKSLFDRFKKAKSKGKFFFKHIKSNEKILVNKVEA